EVLGVSEIKQLRTACGQCGIGELRSGNSRAAVRNRIVQAVIIVEVISKEIPESRVLIDANATFIITQLSGESRAGEIAAIVGLGNKTKVQNGRSHRGPCALGYDGVRKDALALGSAARKIIRLTVRDCACWQTHSGV